MALFKHKNNTDVAFQVLKKFFVPEKLLYKLKIRWWNIGKCHPPWDMGLDQKIQISQADWRENWEIYRATE